MNNSTPGGGENYAICARLCAHADAHAALYFLILFARGRAIRHRNKCAATLHIKRFVRKICPRDKVSIGIMVALIFITLSTFHRPSTPIWMISASFLQQVHIYLFSFYCLRPSTAPIARARGTWCLSHTPASLANLPVGPADFHQVV